MEIETAKNIIRERAKDQGFYHSDVKDLKIEGKTIVWIPKFNGINNLFFTNSEDRFKVWIQNPSLLIIICDDGVVVDSPPSIYGMGNITRDSELWRLFYD